MLKELRVRNYAVIDDVRLEPGAGLTVLTGETGAGKSLLVDALSLLLGERASADLVREGEDRALVEGSFELGDRPGPIERLQGAGIDPEEGWLILRRELQREGRNRAWVNGSRATAGLIGELGAELVELHGQHEHQALLRPPAQRRMLDAYAGATETAAEVEALHAELAATKDRLAGTRRRAAELEERADYLRFKAREIETAAIDPGEEARLEAEARRLERSEDRLALAARLHDAVYGEEGSIVDRLGELGRPLAELARIDPEVEELRELAESARLGLEELGRRLAGYRDDVEHDPGRLRELRARQDLLFRLKGKYGPTLEEVVEAGRVAREELDGLEGSEAELRRLERTAERLAGRLRTAAETLGVRRREAAERLEEALNGLLPELGMEGGRFLCALEPLEEPGAHGGERPEFRVSLNPGFPPGSLARIASGGELSRVMLALRTALAEVDDVPCLVFDEIDAGVGGRVARHVARRLARVARRHQVLVVTHLPQIAARADTHFHVEKATTAGRAAAAVRRLTGEERIAELARMLGGDPESELSRRHARELLEGAVTAGR